MKKTITLLALPLLMSLGACSTSDDGPLGGDVEYSVSGDDCNLESGAVVFGFKVRGEGEYEPELQVTLNVVKPNPKDKQDPGELLASKSTRVKTEYTGKDGGKFTAEGIIRLKVSKTQWENGFNSCDFDVAEVVDGKVEE